MFILYFLGSVCRRWISSTLRACEKCERQTKRGRLCTLCEADHIVSNTSNTISEVSV